MNPKRLTDLMIQRQRPSPDGRLQLWDLSEPGLAVRIGPRRKTFVLKYRTGGQQRWVTIGQFPEIGIEAAREEARRIKRAPAPLPPASQPAAPSPAPAVPTVAQVVEDYVRRYAEPNQRTWRGTRALLRADLVRLFGRKPITEVTRADIVHMLDDVTDRGVKVGANRILANTKRFFGWCVERGVLDQSPATAVRPPFKERSRDRVLDDDELAAVWHAALAEGYPFGDAVRLLLLTGQRRQEVASLRWQDLDLDAALWSLPAAFTKAGRPHEVPLAPLVVEMLRAFPQGEHLAFWTLTPSTLISGWGRVKRRIDARSGVEEWRLHDLRRTAATGMAKLGFAPHIVERILNHATSASGPLARVYQRYGYLEEKRHALCAWATEVAAIVAARPSPSRGAARGRMVAPYATKSRATRRGA